MKDKMQLISIIIIIVVIGVALLIVVYEIKYEIPRTNAIENCLENLAKNICEEKGLYLLGISYYSGYFFKCGEDERTPFSDGKQFKFLDKEVKECGGK